MCYDRSNLWLAHSSVQNHLGSNARDPNRGSSAPILIQRLARRPVHRRSGRLRPSRPFRQPASRARTARHGAVSSRDPGTPPSGGSLRRQPRQGAVSSPRRCPNQPLLGSMWRKWLKAAAWTLAFLQPPQRPCAAPHSETFDNSLSLDEVAEPSPKNRLAGTPKHKPGTARLPPNRGFAFDYLAPFAVPPQLPQASAPKRLSADSRPQLFPPSAFFILPSAFAF